MKRLTTTLTLAAALALAGVAAAPPARADVTNPADNPVKITVTGDDGNTYVDGQDTLPGFDDYACTYIPGAWFDFAHNRVHYADGQSIPWTEWDRATGYQAWLAKQGAPAPGTTTASTGAASNTTQKSGTHAQGVAAPAGSSAPTASPIPSATPSSGPTALAGGPSAAPSASTSDVVLAASSADRGSGGGSSTTAGLAILGVLFGLGGLAFGGYTFTRARHSSKESLS